MRSVSLPEFLFSCTLAWVLVVLTNVFTLTLFIQECLSFQSAQCVELKCGRGGDCQPHLSSWAAQPKSPHLLFLTLNLAGTLQAQSHRRQEACPEIYQITYKFNHNKTPHTIMVVMSNSLMRVDVHFKGIF